MHNLGIEALGCGLEVLDLCWRHNDIDNGAGGGVALPCRELELAHNLLKLGRIAGDVNAIDLPIVVADRLRNRSSGRKAQRGESDTEELHGDERATTKSS